MTTLEQWILAHIKIKGRAVNLTDKIQRSTRKSPRPRDEGQGYVDARRETDDGIEYIEEDMRVDQKGEMDINIGKSI